MRITKFLFQIAAYLPLPILYRLADLLYFILYYLIRYRRKVVRQNLTYAFPDLYYQKRKEIEKAFYRNFSDNFVETIKLFSNNASEILQRYQLDVESYTFLASYHRPVIVCLGHQFNWEWGSWALPILTPFKVYAFYLPLSNKKMDHLLYELRAKMGTRPVPANQFRNYVKEILLDQGLCVMIADQSPANLETAYWIPFFSRLTPFLPGMEKLAKLLNSPVAFASIKKISRGLYKVHTTLLTDNPRAHPDGEITKLFVQALEKSIQEQPENWLWSHRRWKYAKPFLNPKH